MDYAQKCCPGNEPRIMVTDEFVAQNRLAIIPEVAKTIMNDADDYFGFAREVAIDFLPFEDAKQYLKPEYILKVAGGATAYVQITDVKEAAQDFLDYMVFAWMKAMDERGISASRSVLKLATWMKILGRPDVANILEDDHLFAPYGRPALRKACLVLGIDCPTYL